MKPLLHFYATHAALCLIFTLAAVLRIECARDELWIDEYITAWTVASSWNASHERAKISHQAPLYTILMFGITRVGEPTAAWLRVPSIVSGLVVVGLSAWLAWKLTQLRSAAIFAAFLAAIDPNFVFYASEARPYAIVQCLGLVSACCLLKWRSCQSQGANAVLTVGRRCLALWVASSIAMFYFHYTSAIAIACQCICGWFASRKRHEAGKMWIAASLFVIVACAPGGVALYSIGTRSTDWEAFSSLAELFSSLKFFGIVYLLPALVGLIVANFDHRRRGIADWSGVVLLLSYSLVTISIVAIVTALHFAPLGHYRYVIAATGVGPAIGASCLALSNRGWTRAVLAIAIAIVAWLHTSIGGILHQGTLQPPMRWERWSEIVGRLNAEVENSPQQVIVFPNLIEDHRIPAQNLGVHQSYFWAPLAVVDSLDQRYTVVALPTWSQKRFDDSSLAQIRNANGAWLVIRGASESDPQLDGTLANSIIDELLVGFGQEAADVRVESFGPANSVVQLFRVRLTSK